jgi:hypothetical protein
MQCTSRPTGPSVLPTLQIFTAIMLVLLTVGKWIAQRCPSSGIIFVSSSEKSANWLKSYYGKTDT